MYSSTVFPDGYVQAGYEILYLIFMCEELSRSKYSMLMVKIEKILKLPYTVRYAEINQFT